MEGREADVKKGKGIRGRATLAPPHAELDTDPENGAVSLP